MKSQDGQISLLYEDPDFDAKLATWQSGIHNGFSRRLQVGEVLAVVADDGVWLIRIESVRDRIQYEAEMEVEVLKVGDENQPTARLLHYGDELLAGSHSVYWLPIHGEVGVSFDSPVDGDIAYELGVVDTPDTVEVFRHQFASGREIDLPPKATERFGRN